MLELSLALRHAAALAVQRRAHALDGSLLPDDEYDRLIERIETERLALFRAYVGVTVRGVSRLLLRLCASERIDLDEVAEWLRPDAAWPEWLCGEPARWRFAKGMPAHALRKSTTARGLAGFVEGGLVLRERSGKVFGIGVRVKARSLEVGLDLGPVWIRTRGRFGLAIVEGELPEVVAAALPGRMLDDLVGHPVVNGLGMRIVGVEPREERGSVVRFRCGMAPWRMPWARRAPVAVSACTQQIVAALLSGPVAGRRRSAGE